MLWFGSLTVLKAANRHLRAASVYVLASAAAVGLAAALLDYTDSLASAGLALLVMDAAMALYTLGAAALLLAERPWSLLLHALDPRPMVALARSRFSLR